MKSAEKISLRLDTYLNREGKITHLLFIDSICIISGCSAAVLALRYGHIECANQITHRDCDEFFVIPRPLSIYETPPSTDVNHTTTWISKKKKKTISHNSPTVKNDVRPSAFSFGLLKIIFNDNDSSYSTRLAGICNENKPNNHRQRNRNKKQTKPTKPQTSHYCSTEALVNELQTSTIDEDHHINYEYSDDINNTDRASPRIELLMQRHTSNEQILFSNDETKNKTSLPTTYRQASDSSLNQIEQTVSLLYESPRAQNKLQRPKTAVIPRNLTSVNAVGVPSRLSTPKTPAVTSYKKIKKKPLLINRPNSASFIPKQHHANLTSEASTYSQTLYAGRPLSAVLQNHQRHPPVQRTVDSSCSIREAKGATSRFNKPEELFGLKPAELFGLTEHQPKLMNHRQLNHKTHSQQQQPVWRQEVDHLVDLYNIHHSSNYRPTAVPPPPSQLPGPAETTTDVLHNGRPRGMSISKNASRLPTNPKQSTFATLNIPRRNSFSRHSAIKLTNA
jgi:hypothetical protein